MEQALRKYRKIAVLRANAIGDFIFALPALTALRERFPESEIVLLGKAWHREFLSGRPGPVDRVLVIPPYPGVGYPADARVDERVLDHFFAQAVDERFDLAIQLHGGGRYSNPFMQRLGAGTTIGLKTPDAAALDKTVPYIYFQSEFLRYLEVVSLVQAHPVGLEPSLAVTLGDRKEAAPFIPSRPLAVLHPGASDPRRRWPVEKFAKVGDALAEAGAAVVVTGAAEESSVVKAVIDLMNQRARNLCGALSLGGLAALLTSARVVVSNDTGPLHMAVAVGAPTVGLFWCGNLINAGPMTRKRHRPALAWRVHCPECGVHCIESACEHRSSFIADIPTDEVIPSALELFSE